MYILAFDTSTAFGGAAVLKDNQIVSRHEWSREGSHGELLTPALEQCLSSASIKASDINFVAVGIGPGSFTGVRISVNAARSFAYALGIPVYAFDTSWILASGVTRTDLPLITMINAQKNLIFTAQYEWDKSLCSWHRTTELEARSIEQVARDIQTPHLCVGDAYEEYKKILPQTLTDQLIHDASQGTDYPQADVLGQMAWRAFTENNQSNKPLDWKSVHALYIRACSAEEKLRESR